MFLGITSACYTGACSIRESMEYIKSAGFDCIDFDLFNYSAPDGPLMSDGWRSWAKEVRETAANSGLFIHQAHAWFGLSISSFEYAPPSALFHRSIEACALLGAGELIFHPVFFRNIGDCAEVKERLFDYNIRWFSELARTAKPLGVYINIENTINIKDPPRHVPFTTASDMSDAMSALNDPAYGVCLDTGHARIQNLDNADMIRQFGGSLRSLHLNDNLGPISGAPFDQHMFPGMGTVDFASVFAALKEVGFPGVFVLEPKGFLTRMPLPVRHAALACGAAITRAYAVGAGYN